MRQTRLSIGCQEWQETVKRIGPAAAGVLLYLRTLMRTMQVAEITISMRELASAMKLDTETVGNLICMILDAELLEAEPGPDGLTTYLCKEEAKAQADMFRKRAARLLAKHIGQSEETRGQSGVLTATSEDLSVKQYETDFFMIYSGPSEKAEKEPHTPQKEESLTEIQTHTRSNKTCEQPELPSDPLEAEYIDVIGSWPPSLRNAIRAEKDDVREAFYLFVRQRQTDAGKVWTADQVRIAWLAARRIPEERRADSILAAAMANWKTIRDVGSGMYFEKETGRIVSLVRGPVEARGTPADQSNSELATRLARTMRRD